MPEVVQTWLRLSYLKVAFYAVQLFWSLGELVQDAAAFTEDFLQPLFQPIVALSVREKGRRGRSEIMVVNILKKNMGRATMHRIWMKGWRDWNLFTWIKQFAESFFNTNGSFDQRNVSAFLFKHPCCSFQLLKVKKKKKTLYRQYLSNFVCRLFEPKSSSEKRFISAIHC